MANVGLPLKGNSDVFFGETLRSYRLQLLVGGEVCEVACPASGKLGSRDGQYFEFGLAMGNKRLRIAVGASGTLLAESGRDMLMPIAILRSARRAVLEGKTEFFLHTGNFKQILSGHLADSPADSLRTAIADYLMERYDLKFEAPFSVVEMMVGVESGPDRVLRELHYLHKHEFISFRWPSEQWNERGDVEDWFAEEFDITRANYANLTREFGSIGVPPPHTQESIESSWDYFICHASEDKIDVVEPLAAALQRSGAKVWYDRWSLTLGDSLRRKIDEGLAKSRFGIVVLSPNFFEKDWPQRELDGLVQKEVGGKKVIIPVWHNVDRDFVLRFSPTLADKLAAPTNRGIEDLAHRILHDTGSNPARRSRDEEPSSSPFHARLNVGYQELELVGTTHKRSLIAELTLISPPDQGRLRFKLDWPAAVPIVKLEHLIYGKRSVVNGNVSSRELVLDWETRVFPGETVQLVGPHSENRVLYEFDDSERTGVELNPVELKYSVYFEDHPPISGSVDFRNLNAF